MLVAIFSEQESQAVYFLNKQDVTRLDVVNFISHGISKVPGENADAPEPSDEDTDEPAAEPDGNDPLESFATNLNQLARSKARSIR